MSGVMEVNTSKEKSKKRCPKENSKVDLQLLDYDLSTRWAVCLISAVALLCFIGSLEGDFVFDDSEAIINNNDVKWDSPLSSVFQHDFWGMRLTHPSSHKSYRPLTILSFRINHYLYGLTPYSYHCFNILLHCFISVAAYFTFIHLLNGSNQSAFYAAVLFAAHPIHTEAVAGVVGRADLLCAIFVFLAVLSYFKAVRLDNKSLYISNNDLVNNNCSSRRCKVVCSPVCRVTASNVTPLKVENWNFLGYKSWLCFSALFTLVAMLCKEVGITALGLCSAYEIILTSCEENGRGIVCFVPYSNHRKFCLRQNFRSILQRHLFLTFIGCSLLIGRWLIMGSTMPEFMNIDNPASFMDSSFYRIVNYQYIYVLNIFLMLMPVWLCFDWSMGCVPLIKDTSDSRLLVIPLLWLVIAMVLYRGLFGRGPHSRCVLMSVALAVVPFLPATNLFFRVGFVIAERVLYIPVAGLCCIVVLGMKELVTNHVMPRRLVLLCYLVLVTVFVLRSRQRTLDWLNEDRLFQSGLEVCPLNAKVHYNLGKVAADSGNLEKASERYREAIRLNPEYDQAMNNLANILKDQGSLSEAQDLLIKAITLRNDFAAAWMNLGIVQASLGNMEGADISYNTALKHRPFYPDCLYNLGNLHLERGYNDLALSAWRNATAMKPSLTRAWTNTLILLDSKQQYETAVKTAHIALKHVPTEPTLHFNLANTLGKLERYEESEKHFKEAIKLEPNNANFWSNLGVLYHRWKKYKEAETTYRHTLKLNPNLKSAQENLNMLLKSIRVHSNKYPS